MIKRRSRDMLWKLSHLREKSTWLSLTQIHASCSSASFPGYTLAFPKRYSKLVGTYLTPGWRGRHRILQAGRMAAGRATKLFAPLFSFFSATHPPRPLARPLLRHFPCRISRIRGEVSSIFFPLADFSRSLDVSPASSSPLSSRGRAHLRRNFGETSAEKVPSTLAPIDWYDFIGPPRFIDAVAALYMIDMYRLQRIYWHTYVFVHSHPGSFKRLLSIFYIYRKCVCIIGKIYLSAKLSAV